MTFAIAFVALVCVLLVATDIWRGWSERLAALRVAEVSNSNMAQALAHHADDTFKEVDSVLFSLVDRIESDGVNKEALSRLRSLLVALPAEMPQLNAVTVYDASGRSVVSSLPLSTLGSDNSDREYFRFLHTHSESAAHISAPMRSRRTHTWIISVSRRLNFPDGSFAGVVSAAVDIDYFTQYYKRFDIGRNGAIVLAYDSGVMAVREPLQANSIGSDISASPTFRDYASRQFSGSMTLTSELDNVTRLNSFRHLDRYPLFVNVALSREDILAGWRAGAIGQACTLAALVIAIVLIGSRLVGQIKLRATAQGELVEAHRSLSAFNRSLEQLAMQDSLTELANRRRFDIALDDAHRRAMRQGGSLALIMIDIDYFKQYNDIYGHVAGDQCLRLIGRVVQESGQRRPDDLVARYGGEELGVLLPGATAESARLIAEAIGQEVRALEIEHNGSPHGVVTISAGIAAIHEPRRDSLSEALIRRADAALYEAKSHGRDRVRMAEDEAASAPGTA